MAVPPGSTLLVRVDDQCFWFEPPLGERVDLERFFGGKRAALERLLSHRFPLSSELQQRVRGHVKYQESRAGFWQLCCFGICLPSGMLLQNTFDYDRDLDPLQKEVLAALTAEGLQPTDYELAEHVQSEELFSKGGKPLFRCYLN